MKNIMFLTVIFASFAAQAQDGFFKIPRSEYPKMLESESPRLKAFFTHDCWSGGLLNKVTSTNPNKDEVCQLELVPQICKAAVTKLNSLLKREGGFSSIDISTNGLHTIVEAHANHEHRTDTINLIKNGDYKKTFRFKQTLDACKLVDMTVSFKPVDSFFEAEKSTLTNLTCVVLAYQYRRDLANQSIEREKGQRFFKQDDTIAKYGLGADQAIQAIQE